MGEILVGEKIEAGSRFEVDRGILKESFRKVGIFKRGDELEAKEWVFWLEFVFGPVTIRKGERVKIGDVKNGSYLIRVSGGDGYWHSCDFVEDHFRKVGDGEETKRDKKTISLKATKGSAEDKQRYEFKVGDRVQFKSWKEMDDEFGTGISGTIKTKNGFTRTMRHLCGTYATIKEIGDAGSVFLSDFTSKGDVDWRYSVDMIKPAINEARWAFTEDEKVILRNLPKEYEWISRDKNNIVCIYRERPCKDIRWGFWYSPLSCIGIDEFNHLFKTIKWTDDEPCEFRKYI